MATYGGKYAVWAPINSDANEKSLPIYGEALSLGSQNKTSESITTGSANLYGDDAEKITIEEFTSGTLEVQVVDMLPSTSAKIYAPATDADGGMSFGDDDDPPYGGYGTTNRRLSDNGTAVTYRVLFWPRVKAVVQGETVQTKENTLAAEYDKVKFNYSKCLAGKYKIVKEFDSEEAAKAYLDGLVAGTEAAPGLTAAIQSASTTGEGS